MKCLQLGGAGGFYFTNVIRMILVWSVELWSCSFKAVWIFPPTEINAEILDLDYFTFNYPLEFKHHLIE